MVLGLEVEVMDAVAAMLEMAAEGELLAEAVVPLGLPCPTRLRKNWPTTQSGTCTAVTQGQQVVAVRLHLVGGGAMVMTPVPRQAMAGMVAEEEMGVWAAMEKTAVAALVYSSLKQAMRWCLQWSTT